MFRFVKNYHLYKLKTFITIHCQFYTIILLKSKINFHPKREKNKKSVEKIFPI